MFGIIIECDKTDKFKYYIFNPEELENGKMQGWLLDNYALGLLMTENMSLQSRIIVQPVPSSKNFLKEILKAMHENCVIKITHKGFEHKNENTILIEPYALKAHQERWYVLGNCIKEHKLKLYALDRIHQVEFTNEHFKLPKDFDAKQYFESFYGVVTDEQIPIERIVIRAYDNHANYMRTLPIHPSQKEINTTENWADFEFKLRPTYDFIFKLLSMSSMIEVLSPTSLRKEIKSHIDEMSDIYKQDASK